MHCLDRLMYITPDLYIPVHVYLKPRSMKHKYIYSENIRIKNIINKD